MTSASINEWFPYILKGLYFILIVICRKEIISFLRDMLSEGTPLSSRRGIAFGAAWTLFYLCIAHYMEVNHWILVTLLLLIMLCMGFATFPQLLDAWVQVRSFATTLAAKAGKEQPAPPIKAEPAIKVTTETTIDNNPQLTQQ